MAGLLTATAVLAAVAPAQASSLFFLRDGNIWVAGPDGSGAQQVTADGTSDSPYVFVSTAKQGASPLVGFLRYEASGSPSFVYGTIHPDGTGATAIAASGMAGFTQGDDHEMALDAAGDRMAWSRATNIGNGETFSPRSIALDGTDERSVSRATSAVDTVFGDPAGQSLLFDDSVGDDYRDGNTSADGWPPAPAACTAGTSASGLVREVPSASGETLAAPTAYYCPAGNTDLFQPALSADGQTIAAQANATPNSGANPSFTSGQPRLVVFPASAAASGSAPTPLTFVTPDGLAAGRPDFSPDGTQIAFTGPDGIYVVPAAGGTPSKVLANASTPAWSPYTLPGAGPGSSAGPSPGPSGLTLSVGHMAPLKRALLLRSGARVPVSVGGGAAACGVEIALDAPTAKRLGLGRRQLDLGQVTGTVSGSHTFTVRVKHRYRAKLARAKHFTLYVIVVARNAAGGTAQKIAKVGVRR